MKTPTTMGALSLACLLLSLSACGAATQHGASARPACAQPREGASAESRVATGATSDDAVRYDLESVQEADEGPAQPDAPRRYEPAPSTSSGGGARQRPAMMQPAPPPSMPTESRLGGFDRAGATITIDVGPRFDRLLTLQSDLGGVLALSAPDCPRARDLRSAICELSEHICQIADDNPDAGEARVRCRDGRDRCARAREQVSEGCGD